MATHQPSTSTPEEVWLPVPGHNGRYEISSLGTVRSLVGKPRLMRQTSQAAGYLRVTLGGRTYSVHRLVLLAFRGEPPCGYEVAHEDGNPRNNSLSNLAWKTRSGNAQDRIRHGTQAHGEKHGGVRLTESQAVEVLTSPASTPELAVRFGVCKSTIRYIRSGETWKHLSSRYPPKPHTRATLDVNDVRKIRVLIADKRQSEIEISRSYGVTPETIRKIRRGVTWKNVA